METHDRKHGKKETAMNNHIFLPATEEGAKLNLTYEQEHTCKVVYFAAALIICKIGFAGMVFGIIKVSVCGALTAVDSM